MPRKTEWTTRLEPALEQLRTVPSPWVDRAALARLLAVSPRQALRIMHRLGAGAAGEALLISRDDLIARLEALRVDPGVHFEAGRRERVWAELEQARRRAAGAGIRLTAGSPLAAASLPEGVRVTPGLVEIRFQTAEELLSRLFELAHLAAGDVEAFRAALGVDQ